MSLRDVFSGVEDGLFARAMKKIKGNKQERALLPDSWWKLNRRERRKAWLRATPRATRRQRRYARSGTRGWLKRVTNSVKNWGEGCFTEFTAGMVRAGRKVGKWIH